MRFKCIIVILDSMPLRDQIEFQSSCRRWLKAGADVTDTDQLVFLVACLVNQEESVTSVCFNLAVASQVREMGMKTSSCETRICKCHTVFVTLGF